MSTIVAKDRGVAHEYFEDPLCNENVISVSKMNKAI
jgi:hypothetical protein